MQAATIEVANPRYQPGHPEELQRVIVQRALRNDPLGKLHASRRIKDHEYLAGREMQRLLELAEIGHIGSMDPTNEPVDCGRKMTMGITDEQMKAHRALKRLYPLLGVLASSLLRAVLAAGRMPEEYARDIGITSEKDIRSIGAELRRHLAFLAHEFGYAGQAT